MDSKSCYSAAPSEQNVAGLWHRLARARVIASGMKPVSLAVTSAPEPSAASAQFHFTAASVSNLLWCRHAAALFPSPLCVPTRCLLVEMGFHFLLQSMLSHASFRAAADAPLAHCIKYHMQSGAQTIWPPAPAINVHPVVFQAALSSCTSPTAARASITTAFPNTRCGWRTASSRLYLNTPRKSLSSALATLSGTLSSFRSD